MQRIHPSDEADLLWLWTEAEGEMKGICSTWPREARARAEGTAERDVMRNYVHVPSSRPTVQPHGMDGRALAAARREKRIRRALTEAGPDAELVLRLRFSELRPCRAPFGIGAATARRDRPARLDVGVPVIVPRGPGSVAHLTAAAALAWKAARTTLGVERWVDQLGRELAAGRASDDDRALQRVIGRESEALVLDRYKLYRRGLVRVPELVRRRASARAG